ncbi:MAG: hypothetical protein QW734_03750 [Candidatus Bathyarchaeia archaeon]
MEKKKIGEITKEDIYNKLDELEERIMEIENKIIKQLESLEEIKQKFDEEYMLK